MTLEERVHEALAEIPVMLQIPAHAEDICVEVWDRKKVADDVFKHMNEVFDDAVDHCKEVVMLAGADDEVAGEFKMKEACDYTLEQLKKVMP